MCNGWPAGQNGGEKGARASGTACNGSPAGQISRASSRPRAGLRFFFFAEVQPKRRRFGWVSAEKKKEKWEEWTGGGGKATGPVFFGLESGKEPLGSFPWMFFFSFFLYLFFHK